ncbi:cytochrome P450 [Ephemerocybe angulata]|uniref:Cytochrome P450 n=1 Tax=Ephemerocybe angulata TaxID=980116 RepID=A0A8H6HRX1_9AGAR|nr:cytochrome P450 [Tulosesus angulatus]
MAASFLQLLAAFLFSWFGYKALKLVFARDPFSHIPGPAPTSWITGSMLTLFNKKALEYHIRLPKTWEGNKHHRLHEEPKFVHFRPESPAPYHHQGPKYIRRADRFLTTKPHGVRSGTSFDFGGPSSQTRKLLTPVFSIAHMREMTPLFHNVVHKLRQSIEQEVAEGEAEIDMLEWMTRTALELIGQSGFGYSFDSLEPGSHRHPFAISLKNLVRGINTPSMMMGRFLILPYVYGIGSSRFQRIVIDALPWKDLRAVRDMVDIMHKTSVEIFEATKQSLREGKDLSTRIGGGKDIMSILVKANMDASVEDRMPESELLAQISTLTFAGMDTTSNALARILHLLSENQDVQDRLREEITVAYEEHGGDLDYETLTSLPYLDAICRETLRVYPPVPNLGRQTRQDIMLPLSSPITTKDGQEVSEVFIPKDTRIVISLLNCNRDPKIWGPDAAVWKPERWLNPLPESVAEARVPGVYSNLMTFLGGGRACIGFKFSQLEMKVVLGLLLQSFRFSPSDKKVVWHMTGIVQPTVEGPEADGQEETRLQLPLKVSLLNAK